MTTQALENAKATRRILMDETSWLEAATEFRKGISKNVNGSDVEFDRSWVRATKSWQGDIRST